METDWLFAFWIKQSKMLKCAGNDDAITMKADDAGDVVAFLFESPGTSFEGATDSRSVAKDGRRRRASLKDEWLTMKDDDDVYTGASKISDFELKLMDIDSEHLGIPDTEYEVSIKMPSAEFRRICTDLSSIGDTVNIAVSKDGVKFSTTGDIGDANITLRSNGADSKEEFVSIELNEPVNLTFALRYLNSFTKATPLSEQVSIRLSAQLPIVVQYIIDDIGYVSYYLAPKIEDDDNM
jgi:proliferating cell nuclear antigen